MQMSLFLLYNNKKRTNTVQNIPQSNLRSIALVNIIAAY